MKRRGDREMHLNLCAMHLLTTGFGAAAGVKASWAAAAERAWGAAGPTLEGYGMRAS